MSENVNESMKKLSISDGGKAEASAEDNESESQSMGATGGSPPPESQSTDSEDDKSSDSDSEYASSCSDIESASDLTGSQVWRTHRRYFRSQQTGERPQTIREYDPPQQSQEGGEQLPPTKPQLPAREDGQSCADIYQLQNINHCCRFGVPIWMSDAIRSNNIWHIGLKKACDDINEAAPGLHIYFVVTRELAKIVVFDLSRRKKNAKHKKITTAHNPSSSDSQPKPRRRRHRRLGKTRYNILQGKVAEVYLSCALAPKKAKERIKKTATHELLHALGFKHEQQRCDAPESVVSRAETKEDKAQCDPRMEVYGLTRFDPFSIMLYTEKANTIIRRQDLSDPAWRLKVVNSTNYTMSELDKVALNMIYPPHKDTHYAPVWSEKKKLYYCSRKVMGGHNRPLPPLEDSSEFCGRNQEEGPNCPACRTIKGPGSPFDKDKLQWQGWSGLIYCGKKYKDPSTDTFENTRKPSHDGVCGPDYGMPCEDCRRLLYDTPRPPE